MSEGEIAEVIGAHGLWIMFILTVVEGPIVTLTAGAMAAKGVFDVRAVFVLAFVGDILGDAVLYAIGRLSPRLTRRLAGKRVDAVVERTHGLRDLMHGRTWEILFLGKLTHVLGFGVILAAGMARVPFALFLLISSLATLPKVGALVAIGFAFGRTFDLTWLISGGVLLVLIFGFIAYRSRVAS